MKILKVIALSVLFFGKLFNSSNASIHELEEVKVSLSESKTNRVILIIGARWGEPDFEERFKHLTSQPNTFLILGDIEKPTGSYPAGHALVGDFSKLENLEKLAMALPGQLDVVITDGAGTTKFLTTYTDKHLSKLYNLLRPKGCLFFHDVINIAFYQVAPTPAPQFALYFSEAECKDGSLGEKLEHYIRLPDLYIPDSLSDEIFVSNEKVHSLTQQVMDLVQSHTPHDRPKFMVTINLLHKLGLENAGLTRGLDFIEKTEEEIRPRIIRALKRNHFLSFNLPNLIDKIKASRETSLRKIFSSAIVTSLDRDQESLNIITPRDNSNLKYIVYKIEK